MPAIPWRDDPVETAKLDQGRADAYRLLGRSTSFVLVAQEADGLITYSAACDGEFILTAAQVLSQSFITQYLEGGEAQ